MSIAANKLKDPSMRFQQVLCLVCLLVSMAGCDKAGEVTPPQKESTASLPEPEGWASKPPKEWPQLVLTNQAQFDGHTALNGASSFLLKDRGGNILLATAHHLLGENGGVNPPVELKSFNSAIRTWRAYPRCLPQNFIVAEKLGVHGLEIPNSDWLVLAVKSSQSPLPAVPLKLRKAPVQIGDKVYLLGCPYVETTCKQNVYEGTVTARGYKDRFRFDIKPAVDIRGFSGAPILDQNGFVVGVMTIWFDPRMDGNNFLEAGGEDSSTLFPLVEK